MYTVTRYVGLSGLKNCGVVDADKIIRNAHPSKEGYNTLKTFVNCKTILNLDISSDKNIIESLGMKEIWFPLEAFLPISKKSFNYILDIITNTNNYPLDIHCIEGKDRTGVVSAMYSVKILKHSLDEAEEEMEQYGFHNFWIPLKYSLREFLEDN